MAIIYLILGIIYLGLSLGISRWLYGRLVSPIGVFGLAFGFIFLALALPIMNYPPLSGEAILAFLLVIVSMILGTIVGSGLNRTLNRRVARLPISIYPATRVKLLLILSLFVGSIGILLQVYYMGRTVGSVSVLVQHPTLIYSMRVAYEWITPSWVGYISSVCYASFFLAGCCVVFFGWTTPWPYWATVNILVLSVTTMGRAVIIWGGLLFVNGYFLTGLVTGKSLMAQWRSSRRRLAVVFAAVVFFAAIVGIRYVRAGDQFTYTISRAQSSVKVSYDQRNGLFWNAFLATYVPLTGGVLAFDETLASGDSDLGWGEKTFNALARIVDPSIRRYGTYRESANIGVNVYTALGDWFYDFGWPGLFLVPFAVGAIAGRLYQKAIHSSIGIGQLGLLAFLMLWLEWSVFFSMTYQGFFFIAIIWVWLGWHGLAIFDLARRRV
jgi:oligosaccharide repeat unit polymerase